MTFMKSGVRVWLHGLTAAMIGGLSSAASATVADSQVFNFSHGGLVALAKVSATGALIAALAYLKQSPLPQ